MRFYNHNLYIFIVSHFMQFVTKKMMFTSKFVYYVQTNIIYIQKSKETLNFLAFL